MPTIKHDEVNTIDAWIEDDIIVIVMNMSCGGYWEVTKDLHSDFFDGFVPEGH